MQPLLLLPLLPPLPVVIISDDAVENDDDAADDENDDKDDDDGIDVVKEAISASLPNPDTVIEFVTDIVPTSGLTDVAVDSVVILLQFNDATTTALFIAAIKKKETKT